MKRLILGILILAATCQAQDYPEYWKLAFGYVGSYGSVSFPQGRYWFNKDSTTYYGILHGTADSLGGNPWTSYLRSDVKDTFTIIQGDTASAKKYKLGDIALAYLNGTKRVAQIDTMYLQNAGISEGIITSSYIGLGLTNPLEILQVKRVATAGSYFRMDAYQGTPGIQTYRANGIIAAPTTVASGDYIGLFGMRGFDGSNWITSSKAYIGGLATENWTTTKYGTELRLATTKTGQATTKVALWIYDNGVLGIGQDSTKTSIDSTGARFKMAGSKASADTLKAQKQIFVYGSDTTTLRHSGDTLHIETSAKYIYFNKEISKPLSHAELAFKDSAVTVSCASNNVFYNIAKMFTTTENSNGQGGGGFTIAGDSVIVLRHGSYWGFYSFSYYATNNSDYTFRVAYDTTGIAGSYQNSTTLGTTNFASVSGMFYVHADSGHVVKPMVSAVDATQDPIFKSGQFYIEWKY